ncbi:hypothetical protein ACFXK0_12890 [Nocardia sp. NPDC059177]|uniref:hypothetical protein n=1 Tax=Nocardia sp. NPDC059177 TaxID=3346759 RepID=UPI0036C41D40
MTRRGLTEPTDVVRQRLITRLAEAVDGLDTETAHTALDHTGGLRMPRPFETYLTRFPTTLTDPHILARPAADVPAGLIRLANHLIELGYDTVTAPRCSVCSARKPVLPLTTSAGRVCERCYRRDPRARTECGGCGRLRPAAYRLDDGTARCSACHHAPRHTCSRCGTSAPAHRRGPDGAAICKRCYRSPERLCGRCGRIGVIGRRATETEPDICNNCTHRRPALCTVCDRVRPCTRIRSGAPVCVTCRDMPLHRCGICANDRPAHATWPLGPVCLNCYSQVRNEPTECPDCHQRRPLIGRGTAGVRVCGPCVGVDIVFACHHCGASGELYRANQCARCVLTEQVDALLARPDTTIPAHIEPIRNALINTDNARSMLFWLQRSQAPALLAELAAANEPITHATLDARPSTPAGDYIRELLVTIEILPARSEYIEAIPAWADTIVAATPAHHRQLLSPFVHWYLLRRARQYGRQTRSSADFLRSRLRRAMELLTWIDDQHLTLATLTQGELEHWLSQGATTRLNVGAFISWAVTRGLAADLTVPSRSSHEPVGFLDETERRGQLTRCINDTALPVPVRVAGALILLFGLRGTLVAHLSRTDLDDDGTRVRLAIDSHQLELPPKLAILIRQLRDQPGSQWRMNRAVGGSPWLFPGRYPSRPIARPTFGKMLNQHGITVRDGRNSARYALASHLPASVLADLTGTSIGNAVEWTNWAKRNWLDYLATRAETQTNPAPFEQRP